MISLGIDVSIGLAYIACFVRDRSLKVFDVQVSEQHTRTALRGNQARLAGLAVLPPLLLLPFVRLLPLLLLLLTLSRSNLLDVVDDIAVLLLDALDGVLLHLVRDLLRGVLLDDFILLVLSVEFNFEVVVLGMDLASLVSSMMSRMNLNSQRKRRNCQTSQRTIMRRAMMHKAIMMLPQLSLRSVSGLTSFTQLMRVTSSPMQDSSMKILAQLETRDLAGLQKRQQASIRKLVAMIAITWVSILPMARKAQKSSLRMQRRAISKGMWLSSPRMNWCFFGMRDTSFRYFRERQTTHAVSSRHRNRHRKQTTKLAAAQPELFCRSRSCQKPKKTKKMQQNQSDSLTAPKRMRLWKTPLQKRRSLLHLLSLLFLSRATSNAQPAQKARIRKQCPLEMKKVVSVMASTQVEGAASDSQSAGIEARKGFSRNWKLRYFRLSRKELKVKGRVWLTKQWKQIIWKTSQARKRAQDPLKSSMAMMTRDIQLMTPDSADTFSVASLVAAGMQSQVGRGDTMVVVDNVAPAESNTKEGLMKVSDRLSSLRDTCASMISRYEVELILEADQEYWLEASPAMSILMICLILYQTMNHFPFRSVLPSPCPSTARPSAVPSTSPLPSLLQYPSIIALYSSRTTPISCCCFSVPLLTRWLTINSSFTCTYPTTFLYRPSSSQICLFKLWIELACSAVCIYSLSCCDLWDVVIFSYWMMSQDPIDYIVANCQTCLFWDEASYYDFSRRA